MNTKKGNHASRRFTNIKQGKQAVGYYVLDGSAYIDADEYQSSKREITEDTVTPIIIGS